MQALIATRCLLAITLITTTGLALRAQVSDAWVAYAADFVRIDRQTGDVITLGRVYVDTDGSERIEARHPTNDIADTIEIRNVPAGVFCRWQRRPFHDKPWQCSSMMSAPHPVKVSRATPSTPVSGFDTVELRNWRGSRWVFAPELANAVVVREDPHVSYRLSNIVRYAPPSRLFALPPVSQVAGARRDR